MVQTRKIISISLLPGDVEQLNNLMKQSERGQSELFRCLLYDRPVQFIESVSVKILKERLKATEAERDKYQFEADRLQQKVTTLEELYKDKISPDQNNNGHTHQPQSILRGLQYLPTGRRKRRIRFENNLML